MEILLAVIYGAAIGAVAHFTMPGRDSRGAGLPPMAGAVAAGAIWTILTWAGSTTGSAWLWLAGFAVPTIIAFGGLAALTALRRAHDTRARQRLGIA